MKQLLPAISGVILLSLISFKASADEGVRFVPLNEYMIRMSGKDPLEWSYIMERCAALYTVYGKNLANETAPEPKKISKNFLNVAEKLIGQAIKINSVGTSQDLKAVATDTAKTVVGMGNLYADRIEQARYRSGNAFDDPLVASDFAVCKMVAEKVLSNG